jgi:hypothetical protein
VLSAFSKTLKIYGNFQKIKEKNQASFKFARQFRFPRERFVFCSMSKRISWQNLNLFNKICFSFPLPLKFTSFFINKTVFER